MPSFELKYTPEAFRVFRELEKAAKNAYENRKKKGKSKSSKQEGLFKQINKALDLLKENPRHSGLQTHEFSNLLHPYRVNEKVFEAYAQNNTPAAYRVFWCYGPQKGEITILTITAHP